MLKCIFSLNILYLIFQKIIDDPLLEDFDFGINWTFYLAPAVQDPSCPILQILISRLLTTFFETEIVKL